ncbi:MAG: tRNA dimethylallyltransferase [Gammaproteobacteria bacterium]
MRYVCVMGPTAAGKTALAAALHQRLPMEIVSVDSAMVYREMDIGTGKPDAKMLETTPHRLIDICDAAHRYSAAQFAHDARREIADIHSRGRLPLLVGGTGLYFRALSEGLSPLPGADEKVRVRLQREANEFGWRRLYERLIDVDPASAKRLHPHDKQRIQRALEVFELTGRPWSDAIKVTPPRGAQSLASPLRVVVAPCDRAQLHEVIAQRFDAMLAQGLVEEVAGLRSRGDLSADSPSMRSVGYRQVWDYLEGNVSRERMSEQAVVATRQLARRQLTWLRRAVALEHWLHVSPSVGFQNATLDLLVEQVMAYFEWGSQ